MAAVLLTSAEGSFSSMSASGPISVRSSLSHSPCTPPAAGRPASASCPCDGMNTWLKSSSTFSSPSSISFSSNSRLRSELIPPHAASSFVGIVVGETGQLHQPGVALESCSRLPALRGSYRMSTLHHAQNRSQHPATVGDFADRCQARVPTSVWRIADARPADSGSGWRDRAPCQSGDGGRF